MEYELLDIEFFDNDSWIADNTIQSAYTDYARSSQYDDED